MSEGGQWHALRRDMSSTTATRVRVTKERVLPFCDQSDVLHEITVPAGCEVAAYFNVSGVYSHTRTDDRHKVKKARRAEMTIFLPQHGGQVTLFDDHTVTLTNVDAARIQPAQSR